MRPRAVLATKILAVALVSGCTPKPKADQEAIVRAPETVTPPVAPSSRARTAPGPASTPELQALEKELDATPSDEARAMLAHFRPLCDEDGYPLVGNLARKSPAMQTSQLCAEVRKQRK